MAHYGVSYKKWTITPPFLMDIFCNNAHLKLNAMILAQIKNKHPLNPVQIAEFLVKNSLDFERTHFKQMSPIALQRILVRC